MSYVKRKKTLFARNNGWVDHPDFIGDGHTSICEIYQPKGCRDRPLDFLRVSQVGPGDRHRQFDQLHAAAGDPVLQAARAHEP